MIDDDDGDDEGDDVDDDDISITCKLVRFLSMMPSYTATPLATQQIPRPLR